MNLTDELIKLKQLHDSGALSDEEFARAKRAVLEPEAHEHAPESIQDHLMRKAEKPAPVPAKVKAGGPAYAAVAPKVAKLDPGEMHKYTFTACPQMYHDATLFPPRLAGWYGDFTRFVLHLTDRRVLIEPFEFTATENALVKGAMFLGNMSLSGKIAGAGMQEELDAGKKVLHEMSGHCFALPYGEIARVDKQPKPSYQLGTLARVNFVQADIQPLVLSVCAGIAGAVSMYWHADDFIRVLNKLLDHRPPLAKSA